MTGAELGYLFGSLAALVVFVLFVRRAAERSQLKGGARPERLGPARDDDEDEEEAETESEAEAAEDEDEQGLEEEDESERAEQEPSASEEQILRAGLKKTRSTGFVGRLGKLFSKKKIDEDILSELEEVLFSADIGPKTAEKLFSSVKDDLSKAELEDPERVWGRLRQASSEILALDAGPVDYEKAHPHVLLILGVNGVGKTTTIGKLAAKLSSSGKKVLLGAGDTYRAAATEQLEIWGERAGCPVVKGKHKADPSSVLFDTVKRGQEEDYDVVICDTAGRLHTKVDLMEQLKKVGRVMDKAMPGAPHETWLVLDATTGQNAIQQAQIFREAMAITGIVLTKLDGTAKGGVILGICDELSVPVRFIGIGEGIEDLREFDSDAFVSALYGLESEADAA